MKVISLKRTSNKRFTNTCAAIGIFDGVHRGHQYLINQMLAAARRLKLKPIVITFFPHPAHVMRPDVKLGYLTSLEDRFRLLDGLGVDRCFVVPFDRTFARIEPQWFIKDILVDKLGVKAVFVGKDFRFGKDRSGDIALFQQLAIEYGYEMHAVALLKRGHEAISSTRIRKLLGEGKLNEANGLLGRPILVSGHVVKGAQRGKGLGFPTANIAYESDILPAQGVYAVKVLDGQKTYTGMANIGTRPTFEKKDVPLRLEVHIFDFSKDIYGKHLGIEFVKKIRPEKKFPGPQALVQQIHKDEVWARRFFRQTLS